MAKTKPQTFADHEGAPVVTARFGLALLMIVAGIAWIAYYYVVVRAGTPEVGEPAPEAGSPAFMADLGDWNYLIGFGLLFLGMIVAAHPSTPLGRGRGVVVGMLGSFVFGLLWICVFYVISDDISVLPVFDDLGQRNLFVGVAAMGVGFVFATKWE